MIVSSFYDFIRSIVEYFNSLPSHVKSGQFLFDGCVDLKGNMRMRKMLREPNVFYILSIRNYADWIWSAYNYWCNDQYERECATQGNNIVYFLSDLNWS